MFFYFYKYVFFYISIISELFCKNKLFMLLRVTLQRNLCKKCYIKRTHLCFSVNYSTVTTIQNLEFLSSLVFCNYVILGGHILNISETTFPKLIFHLLLSYKVPDVLLHEFYIPSRYAINDCI